MGVVASASAVCSFCRSTLVREGDALRRIGESAELFDDHTPLQLGAAGSHQGLAFTLVGRLQYGTADGTWNEWHALFDGGKSAWLSEDNGAYVFSFEVPLPAMPPAAGLALYRTLQESLTNVLRHSVASRSEIRSWCGLKLS